MIPRSVACSRPGTDCPTSLWSTSTSFFRFGRSRGGRTVAFIFACLALLAGIVAYIFSMSERGDVISERQAVIMQPVTSVKSSPGEEGKSLFILHEGTKVQVLDKLGSWDKVEISDGRQGWLPAADVEVI